MLSKILSIVRLDNPDLPEQQGAEKIVVNNDRDVWVQTIDIALKEWCQGDCVLGEHWFVHRFNPQRPLTSDSADAAQDEADLAESEVRGFAVVTQTCDICPFLQRAPIY
jgi:hypothetical protein